MAIEATGGGYGPAPVPYYPPPVPYGPVYGPAPPPAYPPAGYPGHPGQPVPYGPYPVWQDPTRYPTYPGSCYPYQPYQQPRPVLNFLGSVMRGASNRGYELTHPIGAFFDRGRYAPHNGGEVLGRWLVNGGVAYGGYSLWSRIKRGLGIGR